MGVSDGNENDDDGHGGARVSAAAVQGSDGEGRPTCCVCMEPWTSDGAHRICCIPCGHVYGRSCLENWLHRCGNTSAKCPQCGKRFILEHIINLYAPGNLWDGCFCIQTWDTSGSSEFETELNKQILDMFHEPANIEREHGVHIDEIITRFKLPKKKIRDIIAYNMNLGNIYSTIDDFHYKSTWIGIGIQVQEQEEMRRTQEEVSKVREESRLARQSFDYMQMYLQQLSQVLRHTLGAHIPVFRPLMPHQHQSTFPQGATQPPPANMYPTQYMQPPPQGGAPSEMMVQFSQPPPPYMFPAQHMQPPPQRAPHVFPMPGQAISNYGMYQTPPVQQRPSRMPTPQASTVGADGFAQQTTDALFNFGVGGSGHNSNISDA